MPSKTLEQRFWPKIRLADDECWEWQGARNSKGYGQIQEGPRTGQLLYAHRVAYELEAGPIPDGLQIDHLCRNRACVNPAHLEPVTHAENLRRGVQNNGNSAKTQCHRGHPFTEENTYLEARGSRQCRICRRRRNREQSERRKKERAGQ